MLTDRLPAESLRVGADLEVADLRVVRIGRHDVSSSTTPFDGYDPADDSLRGAVAGQPPIWTFLDFEAPDDRADGLAQALAAALEAESGTSSSHSCAKSDRQPAARAAISARYDSIPA